MGGDFVIRESVVKIEVIKLAAKTREALITFILTHCKNVPAQASENLVTECDALFHASLTQLLQSSTYLSDPHER